jgi:hypothetical protein
VRALSSSLRKQLESSVLAARRAAEGASRAAIEGLAVFADRRPEHLDASQGSLRNGLRAEWRQLGGDRELLVAECAYEQWHRLLFARFLAENNLLLHPEYEAPVTLADCEELAAELGEPDAWSVAARFAAQILPGIFRLDDPCVQLRLAPEGRHALEQILEAIPAETFSADDALGWVYQFWQKDKKDEVNASERRIGGADLGPVTQLFTENYMVRFLLENSLGAWWAARHPDSPLVKTFDYLRFGEDGHPAVGSFDGWPEHVADVTMMDPCCGSGHFLVEAFSMLWQMRAEEEGLAPIVAQDAVLRDNLFGLELDARCVQIAMFAVVLVAWKTSGGWRPIPVPNVACSGIPVKAPVQEWKALARGDERLENALVRLHLRFQDAETLGSLIDPRRAMDIADPTRPQRSLDDVDWDELAPLVERALQRETRDPATSVLGAGAGALVRAAQLLSRQYSLLSTNVPYLGRAKQSVRLMDYSEQLANDAKSDLATTFLHRLIELSNDKGSVAAVVPQAFLALQRYTAFRERLLRTCRWRLYAKLGDGAFEAISGAVVNVGLAVFERGRASSADQIHFVDLVSSPRAAKVDGLRAAPLGTVTQLSQLEHPGARVNFEEPQAVPYLGNVSDTHQGIATSDGARFVRKLWEVQLPLTGWEYLQSAPSGTAAFRGREDLIFWEDGNGQIAEVCQPGATFRGQAAWNAGGVVVAQMSSLSGTLYTGDRFDGSAVVITPHNPSDRAALWQFVASGEFESAVRRIDSKLRVANATMAAVPFDIDYWRTVADEAGPLPEPWSDNPTQWLFEGRPEVSTAPLQVAVARLVGYCWPEQADSDDLGAFADGDGVVCLPSVAGEAPAADRVQQVLVAAFGDAWTPARVKDLLEQAGSKKKNLTDWLRDEFFRQHCAMFGNRPFVWHIWDGVREGFSALVNYHRLDRKALEKLTYTYLGQDWVERQRAEIRDEVAGAEGRLSAALQLQQRLEAILEGETPFDIYVRWKQAHEQPIGWEPDLNDGVRLNVRPFVEAGVLRASFNIHWSKDRGKNPDGTERENDKHLTLAEKDEARRRAGSP